MAEEKKKSRSAAAVAARREARDRASELMAMQTRLLDMGEEYFVHATVLEGADDELQDAIDQARLDMEVVVEQARIAHAEKTAAARADADEVIRQMLALKVPRSEVQTRLGATAAEITRAVAVDKSATARTSEPDASAAPEPALGGSNLRNSVDEVGEETGEVLDNVDESERPAEFAVVGFSPADF